MENVSEWGETGAQKKLVTIGVLPPGMRIIKEDETSYNTVRVPPDILYYTLSHTQLSPHPHPQHYRLNHTSMPFLYYYLYPTFLSTVVLLANFLLTLHITGQA